MDIDDDNIVDDVDNNGSNSYHNSPFEALGSFEYQNQVFLLIPI